MEIILFIYYSYISLIRSQEQEPKLHAPAPAPAAAKSFSFLQLGLHNTEQHWCCKHFNLVSPFTGICSKKFQGHQRQPLRTSSSSVCSAHVVLSSPLYQSWRRIFDIITRKLRRSASTAVAVIRLPTVSLSR
jgi:hypothetical protein